MKPQREWFVVILICSLCFNLAPANKKDCTTVRDACLANCDNKPFPGCKELCHDSYEMCLRQNKQGHRKDYRKPNKPNRRRYRKTNPRGAVIQYILRGVEELARRF
ncbi:hypothetical protein ScPMuIL_010123 [Solemya velum]